MGSSFGDPRDIPADAKGDFAAQAERHNIAAERLAKANFVTAAAVAPFADALVGVVEEAAAVGAEERAMARDSLAALATTPLSARCWRMQGCLAL